MSRLKCTAHMDSPSNRLLLRPIFDVALNFVVDFVREVHHVFPDFVLVLVFKNACLVC